jgi:uncharacterized protein (DUF983 family)
MPPMAPRRSVRDDDDGPRAEDLEAFGDATRRCPECGATLHDDVDLCYKCGRALGSSADAKPLPVWVMVVVGLIVLGLVAPWLLRIF